ncbi:MAG: hypothetical protein KKD33_01505, partial [Verrucomicrobia bacterium]|nr:hypothetical protein [Verrucomicrobiota bacterium]
MSQALIEQHYGDDLEQMEQVIAAIIPQYFLDADELVYACINGATNKPYVDGDPDLDYPVEKMWCRNGAFPYELKRTFLNYEDVDMTTAELLQAYLAKASAQPTKENRAAADKLATLMIEVTEDVGRKNPYGFGFLPKLHGGIRHLHECFEFSADQLLKWMNALDTYREFTDDADRQQRINAILLAAARWLDARDFVTPYMGSPNYARLNHLRHYHGCFAYLCARGYQLSAEEHLLAEARFFRDRMLNASQDSPAANSMNLVLEALSRLVQLMPEDQNVWLSLMRRNWQARANYYHPDGTAVYAGYRWHQGTRMATNYLIAKKLLPEIESEFDLPGLLLSHNCKAYFHHLVPGQELKINEADGGIHTYRNAVLGLAYASWM